VLGAILISKPFVEIGLIDDFSYVKTAFVFAQTGHFVYNGWATAMLGAQIVWAAPFIRLIGYSFFATRVSTVVLATLCVWVTHSAFRRVGLDRSLANFGSLTVGLSPLFLPMAVTFMTDISGLIATVACIYCCLRAIESQSSRGTIAWLVVSVTAGLLGGTTRQIAWLTALVMVPSAVWIMRRRRGVLPLAVLLWVVSVVFIAGCMWWFKRQLFSVPEPLIPGRLELRSLRELAGTMLAALLCLCLLLMPALSSALPLLRRTSARVTAALVAGSLVALWVCRFVTYHLAEKGLLPWTGDIVDRLDIFSYPNAWFLGTAPTTFHAPERWVGSFIVLFTTAAFITVICKAPETAPADKTERPSWRELFALLGPFTAAYLVLLMPRGIWAQILDRYLLPLIVIALIALLRVYQERISPKLPRVSWVVLALVAIFSVLGTHDWIADYRARLDAVQRLQSAGVPRTKIEVGYEFDGITQIDHDGAVYDPRVSYPAGMDIHPYLPAGISTDCEYLFQPHTPAVHPQYFLSHQPVRCLVPSEFGEVPYRAWMPPFHRSIAILVRK
jgi:hypothetical protein